MSSLISVFNETFEVVSADTPALQEEAFRLRYQVYSQELKLPGFEAWRYPDGLETDAYDARSAHALLRHQPSGQAIGVARLVLADPDNPAAPFPVEEFAASQFDPNLAHPDRLPRKTTGEISRLIFTKSFRSRQGSRSALADPVLGLMVAVFKMTADHGVTHWYAGMEPVLNRLLSRFGLQLTAIGPLLNYYGLRRPYLSEVKTVIDRAYEKHHEAWELITEKGALLKGRGIHRRPRDDSQFTYF